MNFTNGQNNNNLPINNETSYRFTSKIMLSAILSLSFVIILVLILHLYARYVLRLPRRQVAATFIFSHRLQHPEEVPVKSGLDQTVINSIPSFVFKETQGQHDQNECSVCLSMLEEDEVARCLPNCNHVFHMTCIDVWLSGQPTCPICRSDAAPRLAPLDREPPRGSEHIQVMVAINSDNNGQRVHEQHSARSSSKKDGNRSFNSEPSSSRSFRLSSFRRIIGRDRSSSSSSSRRFQFTAEVDVESQNSRTREI